MDEYKTKDPISLVLETIRENKFATDEELAAADAYEVSDYRRMEVTLASGRSAFVYVKAQT